jgi:ribosomal protein S18 acetylase RimI-like enzyme
MPCLEKDIRGGMHMAILPCTAADAPALLQFMHAYFPYLKMTTDKLQQKFKDPRFHILKYVEKEGIVGFIELEALANRPGTIQLHAVAVNPSHRKKGMGFELVKKGMEWAKKQGARKMILLVKDNNTGAQRMYAKHGFKFIQMHPHQLEGREVEEWELEFELPPSDAVSMLS